MAAFEAGLGTALRLYPALADENAMRYRVYFASAGLDPDATRHYARIFDRLLAERNAEYRDKRASERLAAPTLDLLRAGTAEARKTFALARGQREGPYKAPVLEYLAGCDFPFDEHLR